MFPSSSVRQKYDQPFPYFRKPSEIGSFSQDSKRTFHHDRGQLKYYKESSLSDPHFDLSDGYSTLIRKDETKKEYLDDMLRWVMCNPNKFAIKPDGLKPDDKIIRYLIMFRSRHFYLNTKPV